MKNLLNWATVNSPLMTSLTQYVLKLNYKWSYSFAFIHFSKKFTDTLSKINTEITTDEQLNTELNLPGVFDYIVVCLRLVVSCYLQLNSILYEGFIEGYATIKDFCAHVS